VAHSHQSSNLHGKDTYHSEIPKVVRVVYQEMEMKT
jgi:hypothetical protein